MGKLPTLVMLLFVALACGTQDPSSSPSTEHDAGKEASSDELPDVGMDTEQDAPTALERRTYSGPEGMLDYFLFRPRGEALPLVVALHGCHQSAQEFAEATGLLTLAEEHGFIALFPQQSGAANPWFCWNWFLENHQRRDTGEAAIIAGMVQQVLEEKEADPRRVYAMGLSAGGAMSVLLGTVFADTFAAVASVEGCPFAGAPCLNSPSALSADELATLAFDAMGSHARALPLFVVQGEADTIVSPTNADLLVDQWLGIADLLDNELLDHSVSRDPISVTSASANGKDYDILSYVDGDGHAFVLRWSVHGLGHAWPGGAPHCSFVDSEGPNATQGALSFFLDHELP